MESLRHCRHRWHKRLPSDYCLNQTPALACSAGERKSSKPMQRMASMLSPSSGHLICPIQLGLEEANPCWLLLLRMVASAGEHAAQVPGAASTGPSPTALQPPSLRPPRPAVPAPSWKLFPQSPGSVLLLGQDNLRTATASARTGERSWLSYFSVWLRHHDVHLPPATLIPWTSSCVCPFISGSHVRGLSFLIEKKDTVK